MVAVAVVLVSVVANGAIASVAIAVLNMSFSCGTGPVAPGVAGGNGVNAADPCGTC